MNEQFLTQVEQHRDLMWRREEELRITSALEAEKWIEKVGMVSAMTDARRQGPSLYIAICGRRDAYMPHNVQKDPESSASWVLKDEIMKRGRVFYAKLANGMSTFVAPRLVPALNAIWGCSRASEARNLSPQARAVLRVLRSEWEMASADLRTAVGAADRKSFNKTMDELQRSIKVLPTDVLYEPFFTYIWSPVEVRFGNELKLKSAKKESMLEIADSYLESAGAASIADLSKFTGLKRAEASEAMNWLVREKRAVMLEDGRFGHPDIHVGAI
jgi:DNA glycosylase AlkZ-like